VQSLTICSIKKHLFFTVFSTRTKKTVEKSCSFFIGHFFFKQLASALEETMSGATAFGETGKSADWRKQKAVRRSQQ
jgi:hypothetical protein